MRKTFFLAVLAGLCIGLGGTVYLAVENPVLGALLFSLGLFTIFGFRFYLFTGKVGYALDNPPSYIGSLIVIWLGNFVGTALMALIVSFTRIYPDIQPRVEQIVDTKLSDNVISILLLAIGCGMCMFIAAEQYRQRSSMVRALFVIFPVMVFILCSFEHCIANMYYFVLARSFTFQTLAYLVIMTVGNAIGSMAIPAIMRLTWEEEDGYDED